MSLKSKILDYIKESGPKSDREIADHFALKQPSVRRTRGELVKAKQLEAAEKSDETRWRIPTDKAKDASASAAPRFKAEPDAVPPVQKDWRNTGFTF